MQSAPPALFSLPYGLYAGLNRMSALTIFVCSGLLVYWVARTFLLLHAPEEVIAETLECDLWRGRRFLLGLRSAFEPPQQFVG